VVVEVDVVVVLVRPGDVPLLPCETPGEVLVFVCPGAVALP
jgi:hypothetical protein